MAADYLFLHEEQLIEVNERISGVQAEAEAAQQTADNASNRAGVAETYAQIAQQTAATAYNKALNAEELARTARTKAEAAQEAARQAKTAADQAEEKAEQAETKADSVLSIAQEAEAKAEQAETKADSVLSIAQEAEAKAEQAETTATQAQESATTAEGKADAAQQDVDSLEAVVSALDEVIEALQALVATKQDILSAGSGIAIEDNTIENTAPGMWGVYEDISVYFPKTSIPVYMRENSVLVSEAVGLTTANRNLIVAGGSNITCDAAAPGSVEYLINNTANNRFIAVCGIGGRLALSQADAGSKTVKILSVTDVNGNPITPNDQGTISAKIKITVDESLNPDSTITQIRLYGTWGGNDILSLGQGNRSSAGKALQLGQALCNNDGLQVLQVGNRNYNTANNSGQIGSDNINTKQFSFSAGRGINTSNGPTGVSGLGQYPLILANTLFAIGNGTGAATSQRSNAFEVTKDGGIILKSPGGSKYKITVDDNGEWVKTRV